MYRAKSRPGFGFAFYDPRARQGGGSSLPPHRRLANASIAISCGSTLSRSCRSRPGTSRRTRRLLRWEHPELGLLPPDEFIPLAEGSGLIVPIGRWVLRRSVHAMPRGSLAAAADPIEIAVNVSARQLQHPDFVTHVEEALAVSHLPPEQLVLELTESVVIDTSDVDCASSCCARRGSRSRSTTSAPATGSLVYLQRLPIDIVKIDKSFTAAVDQDDEGKALLHAIVGFGTALGTRLVAEGIERQGQDDVMQELGVQNAQGFHYGRPKPTAEL